MEDRSRFAHLFTRLLVVDAAAGVGATTSWLMNLDVLDPRGTAILCVLVFVAHAAAWGTPLWLSCAGLLGRDQDPATCSDEALLRADRASYRLPSRLALSWSLSWAFYYLAVAGLVWFAFPELIDFGVLELTGLVILLGSVSVGPGAVGFAVSSVLLQDTQVVIAAELGRRKLSPARAPAPMARRMMFVLLGVSFASISWIAAMGWLAIGQGTRDTTLEQVRNEARWSAHLAAEGEGELDARHALLATAELPPHFDVEGPGELGEVYTAMDARSETARAIAPLGDESWILVESEVQFNQSRHGLGQLIASLVIIVILSATITIATRLVVSSLEQLREIIQRVSTVGDLGELERVPIVRKDEIGTLAESFNGMLDTFEELATAARAVAGGDLSVQITGSGDLHEAFRVMVHDLSELVGQIRDAAVEVASTVTEIHAATQGQEQAATQQSDGVLEVSTTMEQLAESALRISASASELLDNARLTRTRADEVGERIGGLGEHITRVAELLELIREIADRSDILALNGSLEATRAGEAGRGFALVASEMRRLAERVNGTVSDVRTTIADIDGAKSRTVESIESSRELADRTTGVARDIVEVTSGQSTQTALVSSGVKDIAEFIALSAAATTQTRVATAALRERAARLERLVERFEVGPMRDPADDERQAKRRS